MELRRRFIGVRDGGKAQRAPAWCVWLLPAPEPCLLGKEGKRDPGTEQILLLATAGVFLSKENERLSSQLVSKATCRFSAAAKTARCAGGEC